MTDEARPDRVRLKLLEKSERRAPVPSRLREVVPPPTLRQRARRMAARYARRARCAAERARMSASRDLVVAIETDAGALRRTRGERLAQKIALPPGWRHATPERNERGVISVPIASDDGAELVLVVAPRDAEKAAFRTEHLSVSYRNGPRAPDRGRTGSLIASLVPAVVAAERSAAAEIEDFPRSLFATETSELDYYPQDGRIELRPTLACDHYCDFCCSVDRSSTANALRGLRELRETRSRWSALPIQRVVISGGEPTLLADLPSVISELADDGYVVELQTNGMALDDLAYARSLRHAGLASVLVSLHSADAIVSDEKITHHPGAWLRTTTGIDHAIAVGLSTELSHVVSRANQGDIPAYVRFVDRRWGARVHIRMGFVAPTGDAGADPEGTIPALETVAPVLRDALAYAHARRMRLNLVGYCGVPPCLMQPYEHFSEVMSRGPTTYSETRVKLDACRSCDYADACPGLWRSYHEKHGDPGLTPLRRKR